ncbi:HpcH/HpaI aldolase/citrate lyase family protein [Salinarimonas ramus]|uniref:Citrate lyase n=1 Tax=Salinarimonas ramus TaxID=690164 RepID=A0A917Q5W1_9HYPH|nr:HpcH/HpaI aldolase/citrate lyase family protein [Salinarimonas ramus]GGK19893.1 citrate lyase [Salinarimonas ramus]
MTTTMQDRTPPIDPLALGATLYMPATRPDIREVALGAKLGGLRSIVLCLEDAVAEREIGDALANLRRLLADLDRVPETPHGAPLLFVRPRSLAMAREIAQIRGAERLTGLVAPKVRPGEVTAWVEALAGRDLLLMPTLETPEVFDPLAMRDLRDELVAEAAGRVLALRIGGNDLLGCLGLRRVAGETLYEGPLGPLVAQLVGLMVPAGFALTAPVYDVVRDPATLAREAARDVSFGLSGKTAIHPMQVATIHAAYAVAADDLASARAILAEDARAVFQHAGAMCEPSVHRAWARRIVARAGLYGTADEAWAADATG